MTILRRKPKRAAANTARAKVRKTIALPDPTPQFSPFWTEALFGAEILILHATPVYYGLGVPRGDGSAVVIIPGFLGTDVYLTELHAWLGRIGYRPYFSGIGVNAERPNLLIQRRLDADHRPGVGGHRTQDSSDRTQPGWSDRALGRGPAAQGRGLCHHSGLAHSRHRHESYRFTSIGSGSSPHSRRTWARAYCPTATPVGARAISWVRFAAKFPRSLVETAIYTRQDGIVDWRYCMTMSPEKDVEVPGTHIGMAFNPAAYTVVAERLARAQSLE